MTLLVARRLVPHPQRPDAAAHALLCAEIARFVRTDAADVAIGHACPRCGSDQHGRPYAAGHPELYVSLSRTTGICVVAVTDDGPVGVDVERAAAAGFDGFDEVALHPGERATDAEGRTRIWVRKESVLKAAGRGLNVDPREVRVSAPDQPPRLLDLADPAAPDETLPAPAGADESRQARRLAGGRVWMYDLELPASYVGAVTVLSENRLVLTARAAAQAETAGRAAPATAFAPATR